MKIRYAKPDGTPIEIELTDKALTMGRSPDADIVILDEKASRMHCGIRLWDGEYYVKDLQSRNGTYLNTEKVEMSKLNPGDKVRIGNTTIFVDDPTGPGPDTIMHNVEEDMVGEGKGYDTILKEIVDDVEQQATANKEAAAAASGAAVSIKSSKGKKPVKLGKKKPTTVAMPRKEAEKILEEDISDESDEPEIKFDEEVEEETAAPKVKAKGKATIKRKSGGGAKVKSRRPTQIKIKRPSK